MAKTKYDQNQVDQLFQQVLGRSGTQAEHQFLAPYVNAGTISPYQISQYLAGTPEAQSSRLGAQQGQFQSLMTQNNQQILGQAADAANASFAQNGRQFSSGQGNAVIQAGQQLAAGQSPLIANQYMAGQQGLNQSYMGMGQDSLSRAYNLTDSNTAYQRQKELYQTQLNDYNNFLGGQQTRNLQGALFGAATGLPGSVLGAAGQAGGFGKLF